VSLGVAVPRTGDAGVNDLLARFDAALYRAKESGRNRVVDAHTGPVAIQPA
jgi:PleD family two-component response regulator